ncbi:unnamed protein product, partial [Vitis vinifera]|uniref:Uncharacterized protein n=1 Tax=Vitis vinifera TaxID=29760 RepID=D7T2C0_VITVI
MDIVCCLHHNSPWRDHLFPQCNRNVKSYVRDVSKECCDLTLRVVLGTTLPKLRIRLESIKKGAACVEVFPAQLASA